MDCDRRDPALGSLALALVLIAVVGLGVAIGRGGPDPLPLDPRVAPAGAPPATAAALGWPVRSDEPDPEVWEQLDGVGPALAGRLAAAAAEGALRKPEDLLQVRGIGARMADDLAPSIEWVGTTGSDR